MQACGSAACAGMLCVSVRVCAHVNARSRVQKCAQHPRLRHPARTHTHGRDEIHTIIAVANSWAADLRLSATGTASFEAFFCFDAPARV